MKKYKPFKNQPAPGRRWNRSRPDAETDLKRILPSEFLPLRIYK